MSALSLASESPFSAIKAIVRSSRRTSVPPRKRARVVGTCASRSTGNSIWNARRRSESDGASAASRKANSARSRRDSSSDRNAWPISRRARAPCSSSAEPSMRAARSRVSRSEPGWAAALRNVSTAASSGRYGATRPRRVISRKGRARRTRREASNDANAPSSSLPNHSAGQARSAPRSTARPRTR